MRRGTGGAEKIMGFWTKVLLTAALVASRSATGLRMSVGNARQEQREAVWAMRRRLARGALGAAGATARVRAWGVVDEKDVRRYMDERDGKDVAEGDGEEEDEQDGPNAIAAAAFVAAAGAVVIRVGGRAALLNVLGLEALNDEGLRNGIDSVLSAADALGPLKLALFAFGWLIAKVFLLDFVGVFLALSAGVIFGGVIQGTVVSCVCATLGSSVAFYISRRLLRDRARDRMDDSPGLRAIENAVTGEGAKAVFTLRLAPVLPLPVGGYSYIYGITKLSYPAFAVGTLVGSIKPYLLDAYLGVFGKSLVDAPDGGGGMGDFVLIGTFAAIVAVGTFASKLATSTLEELSGELRAYDEAGKPPPAVKVVGREAPYEPSAGGILSSLCFWGVLADDLPAWATRSVCLLDEAQEQLRVVFLDEWNKKRNEEGTQEVGTQADEEAGEEAGANRGNEALAKEDSGAGGEAAAAAPAEEAGRGAPSSKVSAATLATVVKAVLPFDTAVAAAEQADAAEVVDIPAAAAEQAEPAEAADPRASGEPALRPEATRPLQPEEWERRAGWEPRPGLEIAQAIMFVPAAIGSLGTFSDPEKYFPDILQELREEGSKYLAERDARQSKA